MKREIFSFRWTQGLQMLRQFLVRTPYKPLLAVVIAAYIGLFLAIALVSWLDPYGIWNLAIWGQLIFASLLGSLYGGLVVTRRLERRQRYREIAAGLLTGILFLAMGTGAAFDRDRALLYIALFIAAFLVMIYVYNKGRIWRR